MSNRERPLKITFEFTKVHARHAVMRNGDTAADVEVRSDVAIRDSRHTLLVEAAMQRGILLTMQLHGYRVVKILTDNF